MHKMKAKKRQSPRRFSAIDILFTFDESNEPGFRWDKLNGIFYLEIPDGAYKINQMRIGSLRQLKDFKNLIGYTLKQVKKITKEKK